MPDEMVSAWGCDAKWDVLFATPARPQQRTHHAVAIGRKFGVGASNAEFQERLYRCWNYLLPLLQRGLRGVISHLV